MFNIGDEVHLVPGIKSMSIHDGYTIWESMIFTGTMIVSGAGCDLPDDIPWVRLGNFYYPESVVELAYPKDYEIPNLEEFNQLLMSNEPTFLSEDS
ncbi:MAG: hypothetical protein MJZ03_00580 [archaeon]|nr:hypothetical protein [archaeon]